MGADTLHFILAIIVVMAYLIWCLYMFEHTTFDYYVAEELGSTIDSAKNNRGLWEPSTIRVISFYTLIINFLVVIFLHVFGVYPIFKIESVWIALVVHLLPAFLALPGFVAVIYGMSFHKWARYWGH